MSTKVLKKIKRKIKFDKNIFFVYFFIKNKDKKIYFNLK